MGLKSRQIDRKPMVNMYVRDSYAMFSPRLIIGEDETTESLHEDSFIDIETKKEMIHRDTHPGKKTRPGYYRKYVYHITLKRKPDAPIVFGHPVWMQRKKR